MGQCRAAALSGKGSDVLHRDGAVGTEDRDVQGKICFPGRQGSSLDSRGLKRFADRREFQSG